MARKEYDKAYPDFVKAIAINPDYAGTYNNRGIIYFQEKEYDKAWADVHKAEGLGCAVDPKFLAELKKASRREK